MAEQYGWEALLDNKYPQSLLSNEQLAAIVAIEAEIRMLSEEILKDNLDGVTNPLIKEQRELDSQSGIITGYHNVIFDALTGQTTLDDGCANFIKLVQKERSPFAFHILMKTLPVFCKAANISPPEEAVHYVGADIPHEVFIPSLLKIIPPDEITLIVTNIIDDEENSSYSIEDIPKLTQAVISTFEALDAEQTKVIGSTETIEHYTYRLHERNTVAQNYKSHILLDLSEGKTLEEIVQSFKEKKLINAPLQYALLRKTLPVFCEKLGLPVPSICDEEPRYIVIIDDSLEMDLKARQINTRPEDIFKDSAAPVSVLYARDPQQARKILDFLQVENIIPDAIICDYKLHSPGQEEVWGVQLLEEIIEERPSRPEHLFLISKSGFKDGDVDALSAKNITYAHSNELYAIAAFQTGDTALLQFATEVSKTSNFRKWANHLLGTDYPTGQYKSPDINALERGSVAVADVVSRLQSGQVSQLGSYNILDQDTISQAFHVRVDDSHVPEDNKIIAPPGIGGPSFQGYLAVSEEGVGVLQRDGKKILLVLDRDYTTNDLSFMKYVSGLTLLKKGTQHVSTMAKNQGFAVAFARSSDSAILFVKGDVLYIQDRGLGAVPFAKQGDPVTFDGERFLLCKGHAPLIEPSPQAIAAVEYMANLAVNHIGLKWHVDGEADQTGVRVSVNIDGPESLKQALETGVVFTGVGLYRTERSLTNTAIIEHVQTIVMSESKDVQDSFLAVGDYYKQQFSASFSQISGFKDQDCEFPMTVRLLDASYEDFLPHPDDKESLILLAKSMGVPVDDVEVVCRKFYTQDIRGAGVFMLYPDLCAVQCDALFKAAKDHNIIPRVLLPNISNADELCFIADIVKKSAKRYGMEGQYKLGTMLERSSVFLGSGCNENEVKKNLDEIAALCDFAAIGFNDTTEQILGLKRGDPEALAKWQYDNSSPHDPFHVLDEQVKTVSEKTLVYLRGKNPAMFITACGDPTICPANASFFQNMRIASISVPPLKQYILAGLIQSGGAALQSYTREREILKALKREVGALPDTMAEEIQSIPFPKSYQRSSTVFICLDDDPHDRNRLVYDLEGYPLSIAKTVAEALEQANLAITSGKTPVFVSDMRVDLVEPSDTSAIQKLEQEYSWIREAGSDVAWGAALLNAVAQGKVAGVSVQHIFAITAAGDSSLYNLPPNVRIVSKLESFDYVLIPYLDSCLVDSSDLKAKPTPEM